jgi:beta-lactam-binding protein with PASTA domain
MAGNSTNITPTTVISMPNGGSPDLAYDPGQRIFLDWDTPLPVEVRAETDPQTRDLVYNIYDSDPGCLPTLNAPNTVGCACPTRTSPSAPSCKPSEVAKLSLTEQEDIQKNVAKLYAQSGAAIPVLSSKTFPKLFKKGAAFASLKIKDAVRVRTALKKPGTLYGIAYEGVDQCNKVTRADNIAIFGNTIDNITPPLLGAEEMALTAAHEVGHALGLSHVFATGFDIMDYVDVFLELESFESLPLPITQSPDSTGSTVDENGIPYGDHNPLFHLLAYSLDFDPSELQLQLTAGSWDQPTSCPSNVNNFSQKLWTWSNLSLTSNVSLSNIVVIEITGSNQNAFAGSPKHGIDGTENFDLNHPFRISTNHPIKVVASTTGDGKFDIVFGVGDPSNPRTEFTSADTDIVGSIFQFDGSGASPRVIGSFSAAIKPVTQPDMRVELTGNSIQASLNEPFEFTVSVKNIGAAIATGAKLQVTPAPGFVLSSPTPANVSCTDTGIIVCDLGNLDVYDELSFDLIGNPTVSGTLVTQAVVSTIDQEVTEANNSASLSTTVAPAVVGDINGDGVVDINDLNILNNHLDEPADIGDPLDLNSDGIINTLDATILTTLGGITFTIVPDVVNLAQADAGTAITGANLIVGHVIAVTSSSVPAGAVISQAPSAGTRVTTGSTVDLVVSSGIVKVNVPNVLNLTQASASSTITGAGLVVGNVTTASSSTVQAGAVISQSPVATTSVDTGSAVNLVVSSGIAKVSVPDVVNLTQANASSAITGAGLVVGTVTTASSPTVPAGAVISQSPVATTSVDTGSAVNLVISSGIAKVSVPSVLNLTQADASSAITGAGLVVGNITTASSSTAPAGSVISQSPVATTNVNSGTAVDLVVSSGIAKVSVPNVLNLTQASASFAITGAGLVVGNVTTASSSTVPAGSVISQSPVATTSVNIGSTIDLVVSSGNPGGSTDYNFEGFFGPVKQNVLNVVEIGHTIELRFGLSGYQGMDVLAAGSPRFTVQACSKILPLNKVEQDVKKRAGILSYNRVKNQYVYKWKIPKRPVNTCGQIDLQLKDGSSHILNFKFKH